jgi:hypothetical protein
MQNFIFFSPKYFSYFYSLLLIYSIKKEFKMKKHRGPFSPRPAQLCTDPRPTPAREASPLPRAPLSPPPGAHLSGSFSPIPSPALADPHR